MTSNKNQLFTTGQAIRYLQSRLPQPWTSPRQSLDYHRKAGNLTPIESGDRQATEGYVYDQAELDQFLATYRPPTSGRRPTDLPAEIVGRLGLEPDSVLAREAGVKVGVVRRARVRVGSKLTIGRNK